MGSIKLPLKSFEEYVQFFEDQLEISRALPLTKETETKIELINQFLDDAKKVDEITQILDSLMNLL